MGKQSTDTQPQKKQRNLRIRVEVGWADEWDEQGKKRSMPIELTPDTYNDPDVLNETLGQISIKTRQTVIGFIR